MLSVCPTPATQVFIGSALVPWFAKYTARYREAQKVAAAEAADAAAVDALEGGGGGSSKAGLELAAVEAGEGADEAGTGSDSDVKPSKPATEDFDSSPEAAAAERPAHAHEA